MYWFKVITEYKAKTPNSYGAVPSLLLMYLSTGPDYGYHMAKQFTDGISLKNGWNKDQIETFRSIMQRSQLQTILNAMEKDNLLLSEQEASVRGRKFFRINPAILRNPIGSEVHRRRRNQNFKLFPNIIRCPKCGTEIHPPADEYVLEIPESQINDLLLRLTKKKKEDYFQKWSKEKNFRFVTFLSFLKIEALEFNMNDLAFSLDQCILEIAEIRQQWKMFINIGPYSNKEELFKKNLRY